MSSQAAPLPPPPERVPYELLDRAQTTRVWLLAGGSLLLAADASALLGSDLRWVLSFGLAFAGWVVGLGGYLLAPRTQPGQLRPFGTGLLTCVLGGTALGPAARVHAAIASNALLPVPARSRADRAWRVCRAGAVATTISSVMLGAAFAMALLWVMQESKAANPEPWYFLAPVIVVAFGGFLVVGFNGLVALVCGFITPVHDD